MSTQPGPRPFMDLSESGLLWLINRVVFHPRGLALALHEKDGTAHGWELQAAAEGEPWTFPESVDIAGFRSAEETLSDALTRRCA